MMRASLPLAVAAASLLANTRCSLTPAPPGDELSLQGPVAPIQSHGCRN